MRIASVTVTDSQGWKVERAVKSALGLVDVACVVDTGIRDDTLDRVRSVFPGEVIVREHAWADDFAAARNAGVEVASDLARADWMLVLDSDERLILPSGGAAEMRAWLGRLPASCPGVLVRDRDLDYPKLRLLRLPTSRRYWGKTHEGFDVSGFEEHPTARFWELPKTAVETRHKHERDVRILRDEIEKIPGDARAWFYLGETLRKTEDPTGQLTSEAERAYKTAFDLSTWDEEAAWSAYQAARLVMSRIEREDRLATKDMWRTVVWWCAIGMTRRADVAELPELAARASLRGGDARQAVRWARIAAAARDAHLSSPASWSRKGFSAPSSRDEGPHAVARDAWRSLGEREAADEEERLRRREMARRLGVEIDPPRLLDFIPGCRSVQLDPHLGELEGRYRKTNPSIAYDERTGQVRCVLRAVNYERDAAGGYPTLDGSTEIRTENFLLDLDGAGLLAGGSPKLTVSENMRRLEVPEVLRPPTRWTGVRGYEDLRLFRVAGEDGGERWLASATAREHDAQGTCEMVLLDLDWEARRATKVRVMRGPYRGRHEKNWMPLHLHHAYAPRFVYSASPTVVLASLDDGSPRRVARQAAPAELAELRGGSQAISVPGGRLFCGHEILRLGDYSRYVHRLVLLDEDFSVSAWSETFVFLGSEPRWAWEWDVEFCAGLARFARDGQDKLVFSFGVQDLEAHLLIVDTGEAMSLLTRKK